MTIEQVNGLTRLAFVEAFGAIYEHSPWVAERAWASRPFASADDLARKMNEEVDAAPEEEQLALLRAHPELGTRLTVSEVSGTEQAGAGLSQLDSDEYALFKSLNEQYRAKFGFPFIFAVKGAGKDDAFHALRVRSEGEQEEEFQQALWEVSRIARFRLEGIVKD
jgi:OHCU decarboxylase